MRSSALTICAHLCLVILAFLTVQPALADWEERGISVAPYPTPSPGINIQVVADDSGGAITIWEDQRDDSTGRVPFAQRTDADGKILWTIGGEAIGIGTYFTQGTKAISDGAGGAIIVYQDSRSGTSSLYAQRIDSDAEVQWTAGGVQVCTYPVSMSIPMIESDGDGGVIIIWKDSRNGNSDIFAQRINASGSVQWAAEGVSICTATGTQNNFGIVSDGAGGAVVAWTDRRSVTNDHIYAQRINASGTVQWTVDGNPLCTVAGYKNFAKTTTDEAGGAIVVWEDNRDGSSTRHIYAQRVNSAGAVQWVADAVAICSVASTKTNHQIISDGMGGAIFSWADLRNGNYDIYAQRVDAAGTVHWTTDGFPVCTNVETQINPFPVPDGSGGVVISWSDQRPSGVNEDIYAQRVNVSGTAQWATDGVPVCSGFGSGRDYCSGISDSAGGAFIVWLDERYPYPGIYSQRIDGSGSQLWSTEGTGVCIEVCYQADSQILSDGAGGSFVTWTDRRDVTLSDIYIQLMDASGEAQWGKDGLPLCAEPGNQNFPQIVSDGSGGVIVTWQDDSDAIYAQRIDASGTIIWASSGVAVSAAAGYEMFPRAVFDDSGGAIIVWGDNRNGNYDIYIQRIDADGIKQWTVDGVPVCTDLGHQLNFEVISDSVGGAIVTWEDWRSGTRDIYAQRINSSGAVQWTVDGIPVCAATGHQLEARLATDGSGGAFITWQDGRGSVYEIYAQRINSAGTVQWAVDGVDVSVWEFDHQYSPEILADGSGGAFIAWQNYNTAEYYAHVYAQHIDAAGTTGWGALGNPVCTVENTTPAIKLAADGDGGAIITWIGSGSIPASISAQRIDISGVVQWATDGIPVSTELESVEGHQVVSDGSGGAFISWTGGVSTDVRIYLQWLTDFGLGPVCKVYPEEIVIPGSVETGAYFDTTFSITNIGLGTLQGYVSATCDGFELMSGEGSFGLLHGQTRVVSVRFEPASSGSYQCTVETGTHFCSDVSVSGRAYSCPPDSVFYVDADASGADDGTSWMDAFASLSDALAVVPLCPSGTQVWVAEGTYLPANTTGRDATFQLVSGVVVYGGFDGTETVLSQRDYSANETILSGDIGVLDDTSDNCYHVVTGTGTDTTAVLDGIVVEKGNASLTTLPDCSGGGLTNYQGSATVRNCVFRNNSAYLHAAGIYCQQGELRVLNTVLEDNTAGHSGGGVYCSDATTSLIDVICRRNDANFGGGLRHGNGALTIVNAVFYSNTGFQVGGGIYISHASPGSKIVNVSINSNVAWNDAGGIYNYACYDQLELVNVIAWGNTAPTPEILNSYSTPEISHSLIDGCGGSGGGWDASFGTDGGGNLDADPLFFSEAGGDLRLMTGSPALDAGDGTVPGLPSTDITGASRVQGLEVDMGAYEGATDPGNVRVTTSPEGLDLLVDGESRTGPFDTVMAVGSELSISAPSPQPSGDYVYMFTNWSDGGAASHTVTAANADTTFTAYFAQLAAFALVDSIVDVPDDQGGWARIFFSRSYYDDAGEATYPIARYDIHRRMDDIGLAAEVIEKGETIIDQAAVRLPDGSEALLAPPADEAGARYISYDDRFFLEIKDGEREIMLAPPGLWEVLGNVSAMQQDNYVYLAPTLADSMATLTYTAFYISAHSTTPAVYFESPPDSGYSVDNIAPGVPLGLAVAYNTGSGNQLTWDPSGEPDFQYYRIYRGAEESFVPVPGTEVHSTADPYWTDPELDGSGVHYKVTAVDHAGNESPAASPSVTTDSGDPGVPKAFALGQNVPNPFNPSTTIYFDVPGGGGNVSIRVFDVSGRLVRALVDGRQPAGSKSVTWSGTNDRGQRVSSGIYFYRMTAPGFTQTRKMVLLR